MSSTNPSPPVASRSVRPYRRIDLDQLDVPKAGAAGAGDAAALPEHATLVRWWCVLPISLVLCAALTTLTVLAANLPGGTILASTMLPVTAYGVLIILAVLLNPILRLISRGKAALSRRELMCIFAALLVSAGIPGYGLAHQLIPIIPAPYNPDWNTPQRGWADQLHPSLNESLFVQDEGVVRSFYYGLRTDSEGNALTEPTSESTWGETLDYWWQVGWAIEWSHWIPPLLGWGVFIFAGYALFYSLVYLVLPAWDKREKLIFPLAKIPEALLPDDDDRGRGFMPAIMRDSGFWAAFILVFALLSYNAAWNSGMLPGEIGKIFLGMSKWQVRGILSGSMFEGVTGSGGHMPGLMFLIIFTGIGIAFLLPTETSFSIWGYYLGGLGVILMLVWAGQGQTMSDFPSEWLWQNNPVSALGAGGLLTFSAFILYKAVDDYFRYQRRAVTWWTLKLGLPALGAVTSLIVIWAWLVWVGMPVIWAAVFLLVLVLVIVGLMRIVAESGVFWTQLHASFFHIYRTFGLGHILGALSIVPILPAYWILYLDTKAFLGSNIVNAGKMERDTAPPQRLADGEGSEPTKPQRRSGRGVFHLNLVLCIILAAVGSAVLLIVMSHVKGGYQMQRWFFSAGPPSTIDRMLDIARHTPQVQWADATWYIIGAAYLALTLRLRRSWFWFPHPIGFVMLCNPLIGHLWFSFFIGWFCKRMVVSYGGKHVFDKARGIFLGMIVGELLAIFVWILAGIFFEGINSGLTLNRYGP